MATDRTTPEKRSARDPAQPAYDNPVGDKGELAAGDNARPARDDAGPKTGPAQGHDSDQKLGQKPPR